MHTAKSNQNNSIIVLLPQNIAFFLTEGKWLKHSLSKGILWGQIKYANKKSSANKSVLGNFGAFNISLFTKKNNFTYLPQSLFSSTWLCYFAVEFALENNGMYTAPRVKLDLLNYNLTITNSEASHFSDFLFYQQQAWKHASSSAYFSDSLNCVFWYWEVLLHHI